MLGVCPKSGNPHADEADVIKKCAAIRKAFDLGGNILNELFHRQAHPRLDRVPEAQFV